MPQRIILCHRENCTGFQTKSCSMFKYPNVQIHEVRLGRECFSTHNKWFSSHPSAYSTESRKGNLQSDPKSDNSSIGKWQVCLLASYIPLKFSSLSLFLVCSLTPLLLPLFNLFTGCLSLVNCHEELKDEVNRKIFWFQLQKFPF